MIDKIRRKILSVDFKSALHGLGLAMRKWYFWLVFGISFVIFGTLLNLLSSGPAAINLFMTVDFGGKVQILGDALFAIFGIGRHLLDFLCNFIIVVLQSLLFAMIFSVWRQNQMRTATTQDNSTSSRLSTAGVAAGLVVLGAGCPTCSATLITPVIVAMVSTGGYALAGIISGIFTLIAVLLVLLTLYNTSLDYYNLVTGHFSCKLKKHHFSSAKRPHRQQKSQNISPDE